MRTIIKGFLWTKNILNKKSYIFAIRIVNLIKYLQENKEYTLSKQLLKSGTAIGALVSESEYAQSKADFTNKLSIALKEANVKIVNKCKQFCIYRFETEMVRIKWSHKEYWLNLLKDTNYINEKMFTSIEPEIIKLIKILTSSINTSKKEI